MSITLWFWLLIIVSFIATFSLFSLNSDPARPTVWFTVLVTALLPLGILTTSTFVALNAVLCAVMAFCVISIVVAVLAWKGDLV